MLQEKKKNHIVNAVPKKKPSRKPKQPDKRKPTLEFKLKPLHVILLFLILTLVFFYKVLSPTVMIMATDQITAGIFFKEFAARVIKQFHTFPLWDPYIFAGIPYIDAMHGDMFYITALFRLIFPTHVVLNYTFILHTFLAGVTSFVLFRYLGLNVLWALLFSLAYMFSGSVVTQAYPGHDGKLVVISLFPIFFYFTYRGLKERKLWLFMANSLILGYATLSLHIQMLFYVYTVLGLLWLFIIVPEFRTNPKSALKVSGYFILMIVLAVGISMLRFIPINQYVAKYSTRAGQGRGYEFSASWALPPEDLISAFVPAFSGFLDRYWGHNPFKINSEYVGFLTWTVAWLGLLFAKRDRIFYFLVTTIVLFTFVVLGGHTPIFKLFYAVIPGFKKFRAHSMAFFVINLSLLILGAKGIKSITGVDGIQGFKKRFGIILSFPILVFVVFGVFGAPIASFLAKGIGTQKFQVLSGYGGTIFLNTTRVTILAIAFLFLLKILLEEKFKPPSFTLVIGTFVIADLWSIDMKFIDKVNEPDVYYAPDEAVRFLKKDKSRFRVLPLFYRIDNNYLMKYDIESIGGHHGNQFRRYQEFIGAANTIMFRPQNLWNLYRYPKFVDLLNVKYVITQPLPEDLSRFDPVTRSLLSNIWDFLKSGRFSLAYRGTKAWVYKNDSTLPRAFMVYTYRYFDSSEKVLKFMKSKEFNPRGMVVLEENPGFQLPDTLGEANWNVQILDWSPNRVKLSVETQSPGILVYSANYYPYYRSKVDGKPAKVYQADYILRAVHIDSGKHEVEFYYDAVLIKKSGLITLLSVGIAILGMILGLKIKGW